MKPDISETCEKTLLVCKFKLMRKDPFITNLLFRMVFEENNNLPYKTMAVDAKGTIYYDEQFIKNHDYDELTGVVAHEVLHAALSHVIRSKDKNKTIWNIAVDLVVNHALLEQGYKLPINSLLPSEGVYRDPMGAFVIEDIGVKSAEKIYSELLQSEKSIMESVSEGEGTPQEGKKGGNPYQGIDEHITKNLPTSNEELKKLSKKWNDNVRNAVVDAQRRGTYPSDYQRLVDELLDNSVPWNEYLQKYVQELEPVDFTYSRPGRRSYSSGVYMPSIVREGMELVVTIDTSGSIDNDNIKLFLGCVRSIGRSYQHIKIKLLVVDAEVHEEHDLYSDDLDRLLSLKISGGGGTDHTVVDEWIEENAPGTKLLIHLTDGFTAFNEDGENLPYPTIWCLTSDGMDEEAIPYGETIRIKQ